MGILGIDYDSKKVAVAVLEDEGPEARWAVFSVADRRGSFYAARKVPMALPGRHWFIHHGISGRHRTAHEPPASPARGPLAHPRGHRGELAPTVGGGGDRAGQWMRVFLGRPAPSSTEDRKDAVAARCLELGWECRDGDARDAYGIAWAVRELNAMAVRRAEG